MNLPFYIARKILASNKGSFSRTIVRLAIVSMAVSVGILIVAYAILGGFKQTIVDKVFSLDGHIQLGETDFFKQDYGNNPVSVNADIYQIATAIDGVKSINQFAVQKGVLHANNQVYGTIIKGYTTDFDSTSILKQIVAGNFIDFESGKKSFSNSIVISKYIAGQLELSVGDDVNYYFFTDNRFKPKRLKVQGIYETHLEEFDHRVVIVDLDLIRNINKWSDTLTGGFEVYVDDVERLDELTETVYNKSDIFLSAISIKDKYIYLFDWLNLLDQNVSIFIIIIFTIAFINIISTMYIFIKERTNMVGLLMAMGGSNGFIQKIFWYTGLRLLLKGLLWGNGIALFFCLIQDQLKVFKLNAENYYMSSVPISWEWNIFIIINVVTIITVGLVLYIPLVVVKRVSPIKSIKFD